MVVGVVFGVTDLADLTETDWFIFVDGEMQTFSRENSDNRASFKEEMSNFSGMVDFTGLTALAGETMTALTRSTFSELVFSFPSSSSSSSMYLMAFFLVEVNFFEVAEILGPSCFTGEVEEEGSTEEVSFFEVAEILGPSCFIGEVEEEDSTEEVSFFEVAEILGPSCLTGEAEEEGSMEEVIFFEVAEILGPSCLTGEVEEGSMEDGLTVAVSLAAATSSEVTDFWGDTSIYSISPFLRKERFLLVFWEAISLSESTGFSRGLSGV